MSTVFKNKKSTQAMVLQGQVEDFQTAYNSRNCKSKRISSVGDKKANRNKNADSNKKAN
jgi:hypothetical protein